VSPADAQNLRDARQRVARLRELLQAQSGHPVGLVETHISWVLLTDTLAYKLKKPVHLPYLDFSAFEDRAHYCREEVRLNGRLAPCLYLGTVNVVESAAGPRLGGSGKAVDVAVCMRRLGDGALWSERLAAGLLRPADIDAMAQRLAIFHRDAAAAPADSRFGTPAVHQHVVARFPATVAGLAARDGRTAEGTVLVEWLASEAARLAPLREARRQAGRVRECHGDLHLGNVAQVDEVPMPFDAIEFDAELRWIDVADDAAFLMMDLLAQGAPGLAFRFINAWLEAGGDHDALPALRYYLVCRAIVRSDVTDLRGREGSAEAARQSAAYFDLALRLSSERDGARLAITHGLPGSGKTFVATALCEHAGAIRVRSDVERKRLFGLTALQTWAGKVEGGIYGAATTARTYAKLHQAARASLEGDWPTIVDAAFLRRAERQSFAALAAAMHVPFAVIDCRAPLALLHERVERRQREGRDASDADSAVLERLRREAEVLDSGEQAHAIEVDTERPESLQDLAARWKATPV
jgi:aminoglycoside phosphotransferase family enzyme/predicted kinase